MSVVYLKPLAQFGNSGWTMAGGAANVADALNKTQTPPTVVPFGKYMYAGITSPSCSFSLESGVVPQGATISGYKGIAYVELQCDSGTLELHMSVYDSGVSDGIDDDVPISLTPGQSYTGWIENTYSGTADIEPTDANLFVSLGSGVAIVRAFVAEVTYTPAVVAGNNALIRRKPGRIRRPGVRAA